MSEAAPLPGSESMQPDSGTAAGDRRTDQDTRVSVPRVGTSGQVGGDNPDQSMTEDSGSGAA
eukprot:6178654-Karenia_brevis.AAC.1